MASIRLENNLTIGESEFNFPFSRKGRNSQTQGWITKKFLPLFLFFTVEVFFVSAQTYLREGILPATGSFENGSLMFSYSLGDLVIQTSIKESGGLVNGSQFDLEIVTALEKHDPGMYVFPNPTSELIHLKYQSNSDDSFQLRIYDMKGILYYRKEFVFDSEGQLKLDLNDMKLAVGLYLMEVQQGDDIQLFKIIKI